MLKNYVCYNRRHLFFLAYIYTPCIYIYTYNLFEKFSSIISIRYFRVESKKWTRETRHIIGALFSVVKRSGGSGERAVGKGNVFRIGTRSGNSSPISPLCACAYAACCCAIRRGRNIFLIRRKHAISNERLQHLLNCSKESMILGDARARSPFGWTNSSRGRKRNNL